MDTLTETKIETLEEAREYLASIPCIHLGGCGISALALSRWIKKNANMVATTLFVLGDNSGMFYMTNSKVIIDSTVEPDVCAHIGLIVYDAAHNQQYIIDAKDVYDMGRYSYVNVVSDERLMVRSINRVDRWNEEFDRTYVKDIEHVLAIDLSDIDCRSRWEYNADKKIGTVKQSSECNTILWRLFNPSSLLMTV
jgi:hypothetical protein